SDETYIVTKNQKEFRIYHIENKYIIESTLDDRGFFIVLDKIPEITIEKVVNLIESIKFVE
ncbi:MAG: hypothetical protein PHI22_02705, partial [Bacilli bacterium]|nr:hypothetical protein [Bacilli bacterium]